MPAAKTQTLSFRVKPAIKAGLKAIAQLENRSQANMLEIMIREYCARYGIPLEADLTTHKHR